MIFLQPKVSQSYPTYKIKIPEPEYVILMQNKAKLFTFNAKQTAFQRYLNAKQFTLSATSRESQLTSAPSFLLLE